MNALIVIGLCALSANAQFLSGVLPYSAYTPNFLHSAAFTPAVGSPNFLHSAAFTPAVGSPITYAASPLAYTTAAVAPVVAPNTRTSQFHSQDEFGQYNFGYAGGPSSRHETRDAFGVVRGSYNYVDAEGKVQTQSYVADALGFRTAATNLPVAPEAGDAPVLAAPEPVMETAEVATARAAHEKAHAEAAAAAAAAPDTVNVRRKRSVGSVAIHSAVSPLQFSYGFNTVHPYSFPSALTYAAGHAVAPAAVAPAAVAPVAPLTYTTGFPVTYAAGHAVAPAAIAPAPAVTYTAGHAIAPAVTYAAATVPAAAPAVAATHDAELLRVENNPGHAVSYRVY